MSSSVAVADWLKQSSRTLSMADIASARLDCLILLEDILKSDRSLILAHSERRLTHNQLKLLNTRISRRAEHEPLAYIRGFVNFYSYKFYVNKDVLVPRPESEVIMQEVIRLPLSKEPVIADLGTGCGALGISCGLSIKDSSIDLYDVSHAALKVAKRNLDFHNIRGFIGHSDLLEGVKRQPEVLIANLPYLSTNLPLDKTVRYEPRLALLGGEDGMDLYRQFWRQLALKKVKYIVVESLATQHSRQSQYAHQAGYSLRESGDFIQVFDRSD